MLDLIDRLYLQSSELPKILILQFSTQKQNLTECDGTLRRDRPGSWKLVKFLGIALNLWESALKDFYINLEYITNIGGA